MADTYMVCGMSSSLAVAFTAAPILHPLEPSVLGQTRGIYLQSVGSLDGSDNTGIRILETGLTRSLSEGSPSASSLKLDEPIMWRFRWSVTAGTRTISVRAKQSVTTVSQRPTMTVKANSNIGVNSDLPATASISSDWVTIGPISFLATAAGVVWVELRNNAYYSNTPAYFDHIVVT
jgi:hypothetical protein